MTSPSSYSSDANLSPEERAIEPSLPEPPRAAADEEPLARYRIHPAARRFFSRGPWEMLATLLIATGVVMLMQPLAMALYSWSFAVILTGTLMFVVVSHFPE